MKKNTNIEKQIDEALESINNISRAEPQPFFYTRLQARLNRDQKNIWETLSRVITRPAIAMTTVVLVVLTNVFVLLSADRLEKMPAQPSEMAVVDDYSRTNSFYDIENIQP